MKLINYTNIESLLIDLENKSKKHDKTGLLFQKSIKTTNNIQYEKLDSEKIFHINTIKSICINYRLRFLDLKYFKGEIPIKTINIIKQLEADHLTLLNDFKIMAPSIMFRLVKTDDPLMFVPIGNNYFYLIDKWGNDLAPLRKLRMWPFKSIINLLITLVIISYFLTLITPLDIFTKSKDPFSFWILYLFVFKAIVAIVLYIGFSLGKNFNPYIWNSKYNKF
ncbi:MAG: hypothetical protein CMC79_05585 [Flavobacteriaceae bacterium]|nr:hypothetical protein [Flavobacteriaceae bacterium]|tara:strand:+ start:3424 stop:4089 length:666 start_codon:yes stop_codon:yes gene_type:complete